MAAQRRLRPRGSFRAVCAAQRQQKPWDSALPAARRHPTDISQRRDVPSSCGDPAAAAARARQRKTNPSRAAAPADAADAAKMLAADEQAAAAHGLPRIDATNAAQYRPPDLTEDPDDRAARLEPTSAARLWFWQMTGVPSVPINIDRPF